MVHETRVQLLGHMRLKALRSEHRMEGHRVIRGERGPTNLRNSNIWVNLGSKEWAVKMVIHVGCVVSMQVPALKLARVELN